MAKSLDYEGIKEFIEGENGNGCKLNTTKDEFEKLKEEMKLIKLGVSHAKIKLTCGCNKDFELSICDFYTGKKTM